MTCSYAQTSTETKQTIPAVVVENSTLFSFIEKIDAKEMEISQAINSSRGHNANLREELNALKTEYNEKLKLAYEASTDEKEKAALKSEIDRMEKQSENH